MGYEIERHVPLFLCFVVKKERKKERRVEKGSVFFFVLGLGILAMMTGGCTHLALSVTVKKWVIMNRLKEYRFGIFCVCL